jgi:predicted  nucleic acid-binding Zn-ribbon protein
MSIKSSTTPPSPKMLQPSFAGDQQYQEIREAIDDAARLYKQSARVRERTEELHAKLKELKQQLRETQAQSRRHSHSLNSHLKRAA